MRRVIATLGAFVLVGMFAVDAGAQRATPGNTVRNGQVEVRPQDPRVCAELPELRHELARLQHELRLLEDAFKQAIRSGNRERARQIFMEIRQVQAQIDDVQHKIRRLLQICG